MDFARERGRKVDEMREEMAGVLRAGGGGGIAPRGGSSSDGAMPRWCPVAMGNSCCRKLAVVMGRGGRRGQGIRS